MARVISSSSSAASIEIASGNRGVNVHLYSTGRLCIMGPYIKQWCRNQMNAKHLQYYPNLEKQLCIERNLLSLIVTDSLEVQSPQ